MISAPQKRIFRKGAIQKYAQGQEKNVLPRFVVPPVFLFLWCILALLIIAGVMAWVGQVPVYVTGVGTVLEPDTAIDGRSNQTTAVIFVPYNLSQSLQVGQPVEMQLGLMGPHFNSAIEKIEPHILSPGEARQRYQVSITDPSLMVKVSVQVHLSHYAGSPVQAQIKVGSRSLLSLFPGFDSILKGI
jgi:hypothetical protein